jgi:peptidoglycan/xylan/chitin deacetylase (PgdA/CDA1 family)
VVTKFTWRCKANVGRGLRHRKSHNESLSNEDLSAKKVDAEIAGCASELKKLIGNHGKWFRPSGTQNSNAIIRKAAIKYGYGRCISYDVDSHDYQDVGKGVVLADIAGAIKKGSIVSLHFGHQDTIDAMPTLLENLHAKGLKPVTLTTLLGA